MLIIPFSLRASSALMLRMGVGEVGVGSRNCLTRARLLGQQERERKEIRSGLVWGWHREWDRVS